VSDFRVLVVGAGSIGERHTRCFLNTGRARVAICELRESRREELTAQYDLIAAYADFNQVPLSEYDCVVVCVPAHLHVPVALASIDAGCHTLIEKPLCLNRQEAEQIAQAATTTELTTAVAYTFRSMPSLRDMKEAVNRGDIGTVHSAVGVWGQHFPLYRPDYREIYYRSHETGGGTLQDAMTHYLNYLQWVLGLETSIYCTGDHLVLDGVQVEDIVTLVCRYPGQRLATICSNQFQWNNDGLFELAGEDGTLRYEASTQQLSLYKDGEWQVQHYDCARDDYFVAQAHNFLDAVEGKAAVACTVDEAVETVYSLVAARESWDKGREVKVR